CAFSLEHASARVDRAVDRNTVALTDDEVFLAMPWRRMDRASTLLKRYMISDQAERIPIQKWMTKNGALKPRSRKSREYCFIPTEKFRQIPQEAFRNDHDALGRIDRYIF